MTRELLRAGMRARSWSMPTARPCRPRSCNAAVERDSARRCRGAEPLVRRRLYVDRVVAAAPATVRRHSLEHRAGLSRSRCSAPPRSAFRSINMPGWYDVDDAATLCAAEVRACRRAPAVRRSGLTGADAPATRAHFSRARLAPLRGGRVVVIAGALRSRGRHASIVAARLCAAWAADAGVRGRRRPGSCALTTTPSSFRRSLAPASITIAATALAPPCRSAPA